MKRYTVISGVIVNEHEAKVVAIRSDRRQAQRDLAKKMIIDFLRRHGGECETALLDEHLAEFGLAKATVARAKTDLRAKGKICFYNVGFGKDKKYYTRRKTT